MHDLVYFCYYSSFVSDHEEMESKMAAVQLHTLVALVKAGPGTTHCEMMDKLIGTDTEDYAKVCQKG